MKRILVLVVLLFFLTGCAGSNVGNFPSTLLDRLERAKLKYTMVTKSLVEAFVNGKIDNDEEWKNLISIAGIAFNDISTAKAQLNRCINFLDGLSCDGAYNSLQDFDHQLTLLQDALDKINKDNKEPNAKEVEGR